MSARSVVGINLDLPRHRPSRFRFGPGILGLLILSFGCTPGAGVGPPPSPAEIPALEEALREQPGSAAVLLRLGAAYREAGRTGEAVTTLERARELSPGDPGIVYYLALAHEDAEAWGEARQAYQAFLALDPDPRLERQVQDRLARMRRAELQEAVRAALAQEVALADTEPAAGTVAVFPFLFTGTEPEFAPLGRALAELTTSDLARLGRVEVLERARVQFLLDELALAEEGRVDPGTAVRSGRLLGAGQVVQGSVDAAADEVDVLATPVPVRTGEPPEPVTEADALERLYDVQGRMVLGLHERMGIQLTEAERESILGRATRSLQVLLLLGRALEAEDRGDFDEATELLEEAQEEAPDFPEVLDGLIRNRALINARDTSISDMASAGVPQLGPSPIGGPPGVAGPGVDPRDAFRDVEALVPGIRGRDPSAEILVVEGLSPSPALLEIILRPPGSGR